MLKAERCPSGHAAAEQKFPQGSWKCNFHQARGSDQKVVGAEEKTVLSSSQQDDLLLRQEQLRPAEHSQCLGGKLTTKLSSKARCGNAGGVSLNFQLWPICALAFEFAFAPLFLQVFLGDCSRKRRQTLLTCTRNSTLWVPWWSMIISWLKALW